MILDRIAHPIVLAPMAGGPSTPELAATVSGAGGLGMLAGAYRPAAALRADITAARSLTDGPLGLNLFVPAIIEDEPGRLEHYLDLLRTEAARYGTVVGTPRPDDDGWEQKLAIAIESGIEVASFTFGCPEAAVVERLHAAGAEVWVTVNGVQEALRASEVGADALVVQGIEAGGHQGGWLEPTDPAGLGLIALLRLVASEVSLPLVAAGGLTDGEAVAGALAAGAAAAQLGTAFLLAAEAGTHPAYREALRAGGRTELTRAFSGRAARGLTNRFIREYGPHAPGCYPAVLQATGPIRAAARDAGDAEGLSLWAGQAHALCVEASAADIVRDLSRAAREALSGASIRHPPR